MRNVPYKANNVLMKFNKVFYSCNIEGHHSSDTFSTRSSQQPLVTLVQFLNLLFLNLSFLISLSLPSPPPSRKPQAWTFQGSHTSSLLLLLFWLAGLPYIIEPLKLMYANLSPKKIGKKGCFLSLYVMFYLLLCI